MKRTIHIRCAGDRWLRRGLLLFFAVASLLTAAQDEPFMLTFRHPDAGSCYVPAVLRRGQVCLPVGDLFRLLEIPIETGSRPGRIYGTFPENNPWEISSEGCLFFVEKRFYPFSSDDICMENMDVFLKSSLFETLFGLSIEIDLTSLHMILRSDHPLPVELRRERNRKRRELTALPDDSVGYPVLFPRIWHVCRLGLLDYSAGFTVNDLGGNVNWQATGAGELLGGAVQGSMYGFYNQNVKSVRLGNLHWRYSLPENQWITQFTAGQLHATGLSGYQLMGWGFTNEPVVPRRRFDTRVVTGATVPGSEVELYVNRKLVGYADADTSGCYRFEYPLHYGATREEIRLFTPAGATVNREKEIRVSYRFLPKGTVTYHLQGGWMMQGVGEVPEDEIVVHGDLGWGLSDGVTITAGSDHFAASRENYLYGAVDARLFDQYLLHADYAPKTRWRIHGEANWPGNKSAYVVVTALEGRSRYNLSRLQRSITGGFFLPAIVFKRHAGFRMDTDHQLFNDKRQSAGTRIDLYTRTSQMNFHLNVNERLLWNSSGRVQLRRSLMTAAVAGTFRNPWGRSGPVRHLFLRVQTQYDFSDQRPAAAGLMLINSLTRAIRLQMEADYQFRFKKCFFQASLAVDLPFLRATSLYNSRLKSHQVVQQFSGSVAFDAENSRWQAGNRHQSGQGMASIRMFIDSDGNGIYSAGEEVVPCHAVKIFPGARQQPGPDGILRITRLQSYWQYRVELPEEAWDNPTLVPPFYQFSFIADPNQFKAIDIPLSQTGVAEGIVCLKKNGENREGTGGIRLILRDSTRKSTRILRTFYDGRFYAMNLPPGAYTVEVDPLQIASLEASCQPDKIHFIIKPLPEGDYISELNLTLTIDR